VLKPFVTEAAPLTTVIDLPVRGQGGLASYRGNCSPAVVKRLITWLEPRRVLDPMGGSGTTWDAASKLGVASEVYDLNPHPHRGQGGFDARHDDPAYAPDLIFFHPPYWDIIRYSQAVWGRADDPRDLSRPQDWPEFVGELRSTVMHLWATLRTGGHLAILVGDVAKKGRIYSMQHEIAWPGTPVRTLIKLQHNTTSARSQYGGRFVPIAHEILLVHRKTEPYQVRVVYTVERVVSLASRDLTWLQVVQAAVDGLGGRASPQEVYREVESRFPERVRGFWREKIRQCLQTPRFERLDRGIYRIA